MESFVVGCCRYRIWYICNWDDSASIVSQVDIVNLNYSSQNGFGDVIQFLCQFGTSSFFPHCTNDVSNPQCYPNVHVDFTKWIIIIRLPSNDPKYTPIFSQILPHSHRQLYINKPRRHILINWLDKSPVFDPIGLRLGFFTNSSGVEPLWGLVYREDQGPRNARAVQVQYKVAKYHKYYNITNWM